MLPQIFFSDKKMAKVCGIIRFQERPSYGFFSVHAVLLCTDKKCLGTYVSISIQLWLRPRTSVAFFVLLRNKNNLMTNILRKNVRKLKTSVVCSRGKFFCLRASLWFPNAPKNDQSLYSKQRKAGKSRLKWVYSFNHVHKHSFGGLGQITEIDTIE
jgi:hypothetical protein